MSRDKITKPRKALWQYECKACGYVSQGVDLFSAIEARQYHRRKTAMHHNWQEIRAVLIGAWDSLRQEFLPAMQQIQEQLRAAQGVTLPPADTQGRALWKQQHRNTGPQSRLAYNPRAHR